MTRLDEVEISKTILRTYHEKLLDALASDVIVVGAGPSGLVAASFFAKSGLKVTVLEKRLSARRGNLGRRNGHERGRRSRRGGRPPQRDGNPVQAERE